MGMSANNTKQLHFILCMVVLQSDNEYSTALLIFEVCLQKSSSTDNTNITLEK